jgi:hypothetical protein
MTTHICSGRGGYLHVATGYQLHRDNTSTNARDTGISRLGDFMSADVSVAEWQN